MGKIAQQPSCTASGIETVAVVYVQSKIALTVDISNSTVLQTDAFKSVMADSIATSLGVPVADVEIIGISLVTRRRLLLARRLAAASVDVDFRVKAADNSAQTALETAITTNKATFRAAYPPRWY